MSCRSIRHVLNSNESCLTSQWVMSRIARGEALHTNHSCLTQQYIMPYIPMSHVSHTNQSCLTHQSVMSRIAMRHAWHSKQSNRAQLVISHQAQHVIAHVMWHNMSHHTKHNNTCYAAQHVTPHQTAPKSWQMRECVTSHLWIYHGSHNNKSRHTWQYVTSHIIMPADVWTCHVTRIKYVVSHIAT